MIWIMWQSSQLIYAGNDSISVLALSISISVMLEYFVCLRGIFIQSNAKLFSNFLLLFWKSINFCFYAFHHLQHLNFIKCFFIRNCRRWKKSCKNLPHTTWLHTRVVVIIFQQLKINGQQRMNKTKKVRVHSHKIQLICMHEVRIPIILLWCPKKWKIYEANRQLCYWPAANTSQCTRRWWKMGFCLFAFSFFLKIHLMCALIMQKRQI